MRQDLYQREYELVPIGDWTMPRLRIGDQTYYRLFPATPLPGECFCGCGRETPIASRTRSEWGYVRGEPVAFIRGHGCRAKEMSFAVVDAGYESPCWLWQRTILNTGYGEIRIDGQKELAHRFYYLQTRGRIPEGFHLHHLCENKSCVRADHLEALSPSDHIRLHAEMRRARTIR